MLQQICSYVAANLQLYCSKLAAILQRKLAAVEARSSHSEE
jgi:hypothetical protein